MTVLWRVNLTLGLLALAAGWTAPPDSAWGPLCLYVGALNGVAAVVLYRASRD